MFLYHIQSSFVINHKIATITIFYFNGIGDWTKQCLLICSKHSLIFSILVSVKAASFLINSKSLFYTSRHCDTESHFESCSSTSNLFPFSERIFVNANAPSSMHRPLL